MPLSAGEKLGPYEIVSPIGAGGMGEVYKARDTRLDRTVAIKVLPSQFSAHAELRQRLEREARAVSSLNHPHICTLYDVGQQDGVNFLVLEYIEGETLTNRLKKGPLAVDAALRYAIEIASALDRAHRHGIVHRDLKPGNVMLTKSGTKLLDFGLAKIKESPQSADDSTALLTHDLTSPGTILGTFQYMAPEQLEGKDADARSDIFAFGAVLYEMLTGRKAFKGTSQASLIASILTTEPPPISGLQSLSPEALERVVRTCLAKDPDERWQSAGDLARELKWIAESKREKPVPAGTRASFVPWAVAAVAVLAFVGMAWLYFGRRIPEQPSFRFTIPTEARLPGQVRISPDGKIIAFTGQNADGRIVLWIRPLDKEKAYALPGTEGADTPFWSPDSRQIAFFDPYDHLKRIDVARGTAQIVCEGDSGLGGDWNDSGTIIFSPGPTSGIYTVSAGGGVPVQVTKPAAERHAVHAYPSFLPDGKHFLYLEPAQPLMGKTSEPAVFAAAIAGSEAKRLLPSYFNAVFSPKNNRLLFVRDAALMSQEMDSASLRLHGEAERVADSLALDVQHSIADFSVSRTGTLAFNAAVHQHEMVWLDRAGNRLSAGIPVTRYAHPTLSPDGKVAMFENPDPKTLSTKIWKLDVDRGEVSLFENDGNIPVFFPDGRAVVFPCRVNDKPAFCRKAAGGAATAELFWDSGGDKSPVDFSPDGGFLSYIDRSHGREVWILPLTGERRPYRFYSSGHWERHGVFSPDGKWIAYASNETGDYELYVQPFPANGVKFKVSVQGGGQPRWRGDGKEIFYRTQDGKMMSVSVKTAGGFESGVPRMLFQGTADPLFPSLSIPYAVTKDGQRFLVNQARDETRASPITIITNWTATLAR